jgi:4'-phosphopantetheinyl transferase
LRPATLERDAVHVWRIDVAAARSSVRELAPALGEEERERAARFVFARDRDRYVAVHGLLRRLLGRYTGTSAETVRLARERHGTPYVVGYPVRFNLSHSGAVALVAVARDRDVGVDVEAMRPERDVVGIARHFFSPAEADAVVAAAPDDRLAAFYRCWTRKEAYLKACGLGLALRLDSFAVSVDPAHPAVLRSASGVDEPGRWQLRDLGVGDGYAAALAVAGDEPRVLVRPFAPA